MSFPLTNDLIVILKYVESIRQEPIESFMAMEE